MEELHVIEQAPPYTPEGQVVQPGRPSRREQWLEVLVFCFLIVPGLAFSFVGGASAKVREGFLLGAAGIVLSELALVTLIWFFLWHNGEKLHKIGYVSKGCIREIVLGVLLFAPMAYALSVIDSWLQSLGLPPPDTHVPSFLQPSGAGQYAAATIMVIIVAISEETIFRGYFMLRFKSITGSSAAAVLISSVIFALGHGYEGIGGAVLVGCMGALYALIYLWRKSLVMPVVLHFMQDFLAIVLLPILAHR